jgi:hypothetical protein
VEQAPTDNNEITIQNENDLIAKMDICEGGDIFTRNIKRSYEKYAKLIHILNILITLIENTVLLLHI